MNRLEEHGPPEGEGQRNPLDVERRVQLIVEAFVEQQRTGLAPDPDEVIVAHPEVAAELEQRLAAAVLLHQLAQSRHTDPGPSSVTPAVLPATIGRYRIFGLRGVGASAV